MAANTNPIFTLTPNIGFGTIITQNTAYDGTGTVVGVFTAGTNGSYVSSIVFKATGTNIITVARIFLNNGSTNTVATNNTFIDELTISATTASANSATQHFEIPINRQIKAGWVVNVTIGTTVANNIAITCFGGDY